MTFDSIIVKSNDLTLRGIKHGDKTQQTILALHGWQDNCHSFIPLFNFLTEYQCYAFDFPGHGLSDWRHSSAHYYLTEYVDDVLNMIKNEIKEPIHLVGHSMGAMVATLFTACFPEKVKSLTLIDGIGFVTTAANKSSQQLRQALENRSRLHNKPAKIFQDLESLILMRMQVSDLNKENSELIMQRNCIPINNGVKLSIDPKLKLASAFRFCDEQAHEICKSIPHNVHVVLASSNSAGFSEKYAEYVKDFNAITRYDLDGGHHCHMEQPQRLAAILRQIVALAS
ncbi:alpha/beta fold hydrolase [Pseudoalteromonas tunicata]|uniref:alpha/beta fold hydrolase n=1 Tax=Pseudoalteromonas tunicata TaxID=314281 RepID=UPI00273D9690|nr:alpha/beta hydrolase [Pseudoalteromonas tunicata]MDP4984747.1 alpha/beta hydrolase [Pseudoalteromonas tunicata]MDP5214207.1 alpha/beta hydrolase [Pseudoalteromonas tunicata]